jgi:hypothetical protein
MVTTLIQTTVGVLAFVLILLAFGPGNNTTLRSSQPNERFNVHRIAKTKVAPPPPPPPPHHQGILQALQWFDQTVADPHNIKYRLAYGSLLGHARDQKIIPHDTDIDIVLSIDSLQTLTSLVNDASHPHIIDQAHHLPISPTSNVSNIYLLFRSTNHQLPFHQVPRIDCQSNTRRSNVDACSFTGPVARVLHFGQKISFVDIFLSKCQYDPKTVATTSKTWHCRAATQDCSYCPSTHATIDVSLQRLTRCTLNGVVDTWCPSSEEWVHDRLARIYGEEWRKINRNARYSNSKFEENKEGQ